MIHLSPQGGFQKPWRGVTELGKSVAMVLARRGKGDDNVKFYCTCSTLLDLNMLTMYITKLNLSRAESSTVRAACWE